MNYDVVVVGAGPTGATAAKVLSEKGVSVLLLDKNIFPRAKPCGGGLPVRTLKRFKYIEENGLIDSYSSNVCLHSSSWNHTVQATKNEPLIAMVLRDTFDEGLVRCAADSGAVFTERKTVIAVKTDAQDGHRVILSDSTSIPAKFVIGADGMWGCTMKQCGGLKRKEYMGLGVVEEHPVNEKVLDDYFTVKRTVHVNMNLFGLAGYAWVFPKKNHLNIGLGECLHAKPIGQSKVQLREAYVKYLQLLKEKKIIPQTIEMKHLKGGVFPTFPVECASQGLLLCGDAGGWTNPLTGEGIYYGMVSGTLAGNAIVIALEKGMTQQQTFSLYQNELRKDFGANHQRLFRLSKRLGSDAEELVRLMEKDQLIVGLALSVFTDLVDTKQIAWKVLRRFLYIYLKDKFGSAFRSV